MVKNITGAIGFVSKIIDKHIANFKKNPELKGTI